MNKNLAIQILYKNEFDFLNYKKLIMINKIRYSAIVDEE